ncbi:MAG: AAA family ATPase [Bacillota bacterium]
MEAVIFIGIQASGKTTFYRENFFNTHIRISLDMLKTRNRESILMQACIEAKQPFVVDNTNVLASERIKYIEASKAAGFSVRGYFFRSNLRESIARNSQRTGRQLIPVKGIGGTYKRLQRPHMNEGFDFLYHVTIAENGGFLVTEFV